MNQQYQKTKEHIETCGLSQFRQVMLTLLVEISLILSGVALHTQSAYAAVTLNAADLAIVGYNSDGSSDDVALIALTDISSGTVIFITDRGWDTNAGTFTVPVTSGETTITWTSPAISAGTIVNANSLPGTASGSFIELGIFGDQVLIYQTDDDTPGGIPTIIYAFNNNVSTSVPNTTGQWQSGALSNETTESNLPAGTTEVTSAGGAGNAFGLMGEVDNLVYTGSITATDKAIWLSRIHTPGNWTTDNSTPQDIASGGTNLPTSVPVGNPETTPPTANPVLDPSPNAAGWNNSNVTINWNWSDEGGSGINTNNCTTSTLLDTDGSFRNVVAVCTDLAGNSANSDPVTVNLDKTTPDTEITTAPPITSTSSDVSFEFTGSDALSGISRFVCKIDNGVQADTGLCTSPHNLTLANGNYTFTVYAIDRAGNIDPTTASYTWTVDVNSAPVLDPIGNQMVNEGQLLEFIVSASDSDLGNELTFQLGNPPTGATLTNNGDGTATFNWTPTFAQSGNFQDVLFTVNDDGQPVKADMETITISVGDINRPPQFDALASQNSDEGIELSFNVQATDPDGNAISLVASNLPNGSGFIDNHNGSGTFIWTPGFDQAGNFTVMFTATDDGAPMQTDTLDVTITIGDVNRMPVLSMIGNRAVAEGEFLEFILTASDPDGDSLTYTVENTPSGATFNNNGDGTATFSWTPDFNQVGIHSMLFLVTDNGAPPQTDREAIRIIVGNVEPGFFLAVADNTWVQIGLRGTPPSGSTVADIIGDDIPAAYAYDSHWAVYRYETSSNTYKKLSLTDTMHPGIGYWFIQKTGNPVIIDMPSGTRGVNIADLPACTPLATGCFEVPLQSSSIDMQWQMIGYPFGQSINIDKLRVVTNAGICLTGCTLSQAKTEGLMSDTLWHYDGNSYQQLTAGGSVPLKPWDGAWLSTLPAANGMALKLLIPFIPIAGGL